MKGCYNVTVKIAKMEPFAIFLVYKRMPNNSQTTWMCSNCKVSQAAKVTTYNLTKSSSTGPSACSFFTSNNVNTASTNSLSEERVQLTQAKEDINKRVTLRTVRTNERYFFPGV